MTTLTETVKDTVDDAQETLSGRLAQAKGIAREQWGDLTGDELTSLAGKKDQIVGRIEADLHNSWPARHSTFLIVGSIVLGIMAVLVVLGDKMRPSLAEASR